MYISWFWQCRKFKNDSVWIVNFGNYTFSMLWTNSPPPELIHIHPGLYRDRYSKLLRLIYVKNFVLRTTTKNCWVSFLWARTRTLNGASLWIYIQLLWLHSIARTITIDNIYTKNFLAQWVLRTKLNLLQNLGVLRRD